MKYFIETLKNDLSIKVSELLGLPIGQVAIENANPKFGADLAIPVFKFGSADKPPDVLASEIASQLKHPSVAKVEAVSGYINLWLHPVALADGVFTDQENARGERRRYGDSSQFGGQETVIEFTDPNPFKELHIGHAYSNTVGESLAKLFEAAGSKVHRVTYGGDVGLHVAKAIWGIKQLEYEESQVFGAVPVEERASFLGRAYALGATRFEEDDSVKAEVQALNKLIYEQSDPEINQIRETGKQWSYDYFNQMYDRFGMRFEKHYSESDAAPKGMEMVRVGQERGVFKESDGAIIFRGEDHGLHTRVFVNKEGLPTYEAKDLGLMFLKDADYHYDRSIILTGSEQSEYFKVMLKAAELLQPEL
ncbi:MAG: arginine--tRNA ligase, partial [Candidatus Saccharimonadales bacterium]|nr:arginine--tRNA ligase [Candidatus Saccharimonadales bacterium]